MMFRKTLLVGMLWPAVATAQLSDTLSEQVVSGTRVVQPLAPGIVGMKTSTLDSEKLLRPALVSLSQILTENLPVFTRATGVNGPVTLSIRGASAAQSMVLWEDIPLQNPAIGLTDLSLLQSGLFQNITLVPGGTPALWGSGNVGGVLQLRNEAPYFPEQEQWRGWAGIGSGSFDALNGMIGLKRNSPKAYWSLRAFGNRADYTFDYHPETGPAKRINNAGLTQWGGLLQGGQRLGNGWQLQQDLWWNRSDRYIPPALFESESGKRQQDEALRIRLHAERHHGLDQLSLTAAFLQEGLRYADTLLPLQSELQTTTVFGRAQYQHRMASGTFFADAPVQYSYAVTNGQTYDQKRVALALGYTSRFRNETLLIPLMVRVEQIDAQTVVLPGLNIAWQMRPNTMLRGSVQRTYRAPTLTERYYFPGGNTDLRPERGWSGELGARQNFRNGLWNGFVDASVFYRDIRDWIIWYGGAIWTPHNIARVRTQGIELDGESRWRISGIELGLRSGVTFTTAKTMESAVPNDGSIGKQIPHTPQTTARISGWIAWKQLQLELASVYTGYRFITSDESAWIPAYWLHNASVRYALPLKKQQLSVELRCNNLANSAYLSVAGRPGLPRHFTVGIMGRF
jgi:iron complex outermembrane receptor protein